MRKVELQVSVRIDIDLVKWIIDLSLVPVLEVDG
jgi:hypothetical protein